MTKDGIVNLVKPAGMTSHDGVSFLRRLTGIKRIGHTGTLDPMACGVLPLCIGSAARVNEYLDLDDKGYRCEMILGLATDTQDIWGTPLSDMRSKVPEITENQLLAAFEPLRGNIMQRPPAYSAVRVGGKRLYEYARKGETVEVKERPVTISALELVSYDRKAGRVLFDVTCSKGTYIRTICEEVGRVLGVGASMSFLARFQSGCFTLDNAVSAEELIRFWENHKGEGGRCSLDDFLLPVDFPLDKFGRLEVSENRGAWFSKGGYLMPQDVTVAFEPAASNADNHQLQEKMSHLGTRDDYKRTYNVYMGGAFLGVAKYNPERSQYTADKVFCK